MSALRFALTAVALALLTASMPAGAVDGGNGRGRVMLQRHGLGDAEQFAGRDVAAIAPTNPKSS